MRAVGVAIVWMCAGRAGGQERRLAERVLLLDPDNAVARGCLGFRPVSGSWSRTSAVAAKIERREDADLGRVQNYREERAALEELRAKELLRIGERENATGYKRENTICAARRTEGPHRLLRLLFGDDSPRVDPSPVYFLSAKRYTGLINARNNDADSRKRALRFDTCRREGLFAIRTGYIPNGLDLYAHCIGFWSLEEIVSPPGPDGKPDKDRYSWFKEGVALLLSLELFDTADSWFSSREESTGKAMPSLPLPEKRSLDSCAAYVREQLHDGALPPLQEVWGNSLNNLDRVRAIQAWSFVRFLALYDPAGFLKLPAALGREASGAQSERTERALQQSFGEPAAGLVRLWKAYLFELA